VLGLLWGLIFELIASNDGCGFLDILSYHFIGNVSPRDQIHLVRDTFSLSLAAQLVIRSSEAPASGNNMSLMEGSRSRGKYTWPGHHTRRDTPFWSITATYSDGKGVQSCVNVCIFIVLDFQGSAW